YYFPYLNTIYDFVTDINKGANGQLYLATSTEGLFEVDIVTSVDDPDNIYPNNFILEQNYPNPFNPTTQITYQIPESGNVKLKVFDILGREVSVLLDEYKEAGKHSVEFNAASVSRRITSGVYFYLLQAGEFRESKKMILLR